MAKGILERGEGAGRLPMLLLATLVASWGVPSRAGAGGPVMGCGPDRGPMECQVRVDGGSLHRFGDPAAPGAPFDAIGAGWGGEGLRSAGTPGERGRETLLVQLSATIPDTPPPSPGSPPPPPATVPPPPGPPPIPPASLQPLPDGQFQVGGRFIGCAVGQGILGCGVRGDDGVVYNFDDQSSPPALMEGIGDDWENRRVILTGRPEGVGEGSVFMVLTAITPAGHKITPPAPPALPPPEARIPTLLGVWHSIEDFHYTVEFLPGGIRVERYQESRETSRWGLYPGCDTPVERPDPRGTQLQVWSPENPGETLCFSIDQLSSDLLVLTLVGGVVNTVVYQRLPEVP